jgi:DNA-binding NtrC family response regulator
MGRLCVYAWPGNVRELENLMERLTVLRGEGEIRVLDLPTAFHQDSAPVLHVPHVSPSGIAFRDLVDRFETDLILQALEQTHWNKNKAAQMLGLNRTTLIEKIKKKGLADPID